MSPRRSLVFPCLLLLSASPAQAGPPTDSPGDRLPPGAVARLGYGSSGGIDSVGFTADGKIVLAVEARGVLRCWDRATGREQGCVEGLRRIYPKMTLAPRKGGKPMALADLRAGQALLSVHFCGTHYLAGVAADRGSLYARIADESIPVYEAGTGAELRRVKTGGGVEGALASPDGKLVAVQQPGYLLRLLDASTGEEASRFDFGPGTYFGMAFSPDGKTLAARGTATLDLWDISSGRRIRQLKLPPGAFPSAGQMAFAPGGRAVAAWYGWGDFALWDVLAGKVLGRLSSETEAVHVLAFSPDGRTLALGLADHTLRLWDAFTGQEIRRYRGHRGAVVTAAFAPDGRLLISGGHDGTVLAWDTTGGLAATDRAAPDLSAVWDDLGADAAVADRAFWTLVAHAGQTIPLVRERLLPSSPREKQSLDRLIDDLDSDEFSVRQKSEQALQRLGERAEAALRLALQKQPTLEARLRMERLLGRLKGRASLPRPLPLRSLRAVRALEEIGTEEARGLLMDLMTGASEAALAVEAGAALERLGRRPGAR